MNVNVWDVDRSDQGLDPKSRGRRPPTGCADPDVPLEELAEHGRV